MHGNGPFLKVALLGVCMLGQLGLTRGFAQSDDESVAREETSKPAFTNPFTKLFVKKSESEESNSTSSSSSNRSPKAYSSPLKPAGSPTSSKIAATPAAARGGFLVPLKSFTNRVFRGSNANDPLAEQYEGFEELDAKILPTMPREPFRNIPRPRILDSREQKTGGNLSMERIENPPLPTENPGLAYPSPMVKERAYVGATSTSSQTNSGDPKSDPILPGSAGMSTKSVNEDSIDPSAPSSILESKSTSRRSGDVPQLSTDLPDRPNLQSKQEPNLLDLSSDSHGASRNGPTPRIGTPTVPLPKPSSDLPIPTATNERETSNRNLEILKESSKPATQEIVPSVTAIRPRSNDLKVKSDSGARSVTNRGTNESNRIEALTEYAQPAIRVYVNGPDGVLIGQEAMYEVIVKNEGTVDLQGLIVRISVPKTVSIGDVNAADGVTSPETNDSENSIGWELEKLERGSHKSLRVMIQTSRAESFDLALEWAALPQSNVLPIKVYQPQLDLALEGPAEVEFGTPQNYRLRVRNPGNATAKGVDVTLTAEEFGSNQSNIGDIPPGSERVVDVELLFRQPGKIPIRALASSALSKIEARNSIDVRVRQSILAAQWRGPTEFFQGNTADYALALTNSGDAVANNVTCSITLPPGNDAKTLPPGAIRRGNMIQWEVKRLLPQESLSFPLTLSMNKLGNAMLVFKAECKNGIATSVEHTTNVDSIVDLSLSVIDPPAPAPVGQLVFYEIEIKNRGKKVATNVDVVAQFSDGIEPVRLEGHTGRIVPGQVLFNTISSIGAGDKIVLRVAAEASKPGVHRFRAEVKCPGGEADLLQEESTRYLATGAVQAERR
jgi:uncharacterized repeat protein (TIGR01451 family)